MKWKNWKIGDVVTETALRKQFGAGFRRVLAKSLEPVDRSAKGERHKFQIKAALPVNRAEYLASRNVMFTTTVDDLVADAFSAVEELATEMEEVFQNMPENLQGSDLGVRREEAANALLDISGEVPGLPGAIGDLSVVYVPAEKVSSRRSRAEEAAAMINVAVGAIRDYAATQADKEEDEAAQVADELEDLASRLDEVDFPGMYG